jgi:hypothetical protein
MTLSQALNDNFRINYYQLYLEAMDQAIREGVDIRGYMAWSLLDNFEWTDGYIYRFGIHYVDYSNSSSNMMRYPKDSSKWYKNYVSKHQLYGKNNNNDNNKEKDNKEKDNNGNNIFDSWFSYFDKALENSIDKPTYGELRYCP